MGYEQHRMPADGEAPNTQGEPADSQPAASAGQAESILDGGVLFASSLGGDDEAEAVSDVSLAANRWYPILGRFEIEVGESIEIAGRTAYYSSHYDWTSSDTSVATAKIGDPDRSRGTITGLKPGRVEIVHEWHDMNYREDHFVVTVAPVAKHVKLTGTSVNVVYDGTSHAAGAATATDDNGHDVLVEYQKADGTWTENPAEITATNVADSTRINIRASVPDHYYDYVYATEALTILAQSIDPDDIGAYLGVEISELERMLFYDGEEQLWAAVLEYEGIELVEGVDYTVTYNIEDLVRAGVVTMVIEGIGNYAGKVERTYAIEKAAAAPESAAEAAEADSTAEADKADSTAEAAKADSAAKASSSTAAAKSATPKTGDAAAPLAAGAALAAAGALAALLASRKLRRNARR